MHFFFLWLSGKLVGDESDVFLGFVLFFLSVFIFFSDYMQCMGIHHGHVGLHIYFSSQLSGPT